MPTQTTTRKEFSTSKMKEAVKSETDKRCSKEAADSLGESVTEVLQGRSQEALELAQARGRKTLRATDVEDTRDETPSGYGFELPNAPVERIMREAGAERVSEDAVEELKREAVAYVKEKAVEMNSMANHANRSTVKESDLEMALRGEE